MRRTTPYLILVFVLALTSFSLVAQSQEIVISGTVLDNSSREPVEFATVMVHLAESQQVINGTTTEVDGSFQVQVEAASNVSVEISFIGFTSRVISEVSVVNGNIELGEILLANDSQLLDEVVVRAERSQTEFRLDKRVFNVGQDLSSTGASALDILNNVPSVNVDIEGQISLRGSSGVQILINGKPSVLAEEGGNALGTITADMIDRIEVITNPSAKYDAEGTAGIINIVLRKEERKGINGSVSVNTGIPHNHSLGLSLNRRTEKFNLFSQLGVGYRERPQDTEVINRDLLSNTTILSAGEEFRNETFYNFILGTDYHIDDYNVLTLSGNFAYEIEDQPSATNFRFLDAADNLVSTWNRSEATEATNPKWQYEFQYKRDFPDDKDHQLLFSALGNFFGKDQSSEFFDSTISGADADATQRTRTNFQETENTFKLDYTQPLSEEVTLEAGAQYLLNDVSNDFEVTDLIDGQWEVDPTQTNIFEYQQNVLGIYGTGAYEGEQWGLKLGLRLENTDLSTLLTNTNEANQQNYTNFFPSVHTSYKVTEAFSLQAGYSRRIFRPRLWDLNPFFNIRNNFSIRTGNPNLLPEFTDSYELSSILISGQTSLNLTVYHRYTTDVVERISIFEDNVNTTQPFNIGTNRATGVEFNAKYTPNRWLTFTGDINYSYFNRQGFLEDVSFDFNADQWSTKVTSRLKLPADLDLEITGQYRSAVQTVQSVRSDNLFADLGVRKKILGGRGVVSLSIRDVFASRVFENITDQAEFYLYSRRQRGRFVSVGFSYGFGKGEAMEYSGQRRRR